MIETELTKPLYDWFRHDPTGTKTRTYQILDLFWMNYENEHSKNPNIVPLKEELLWNMYIDNEADVMKFTNITLRNAVQRALKQIEWMQKKAIMMDKQGRISEMNLNKNKKDVFSLPAINIVFGANEDKVSKQIELLTDE